MKEIELTIENLDHFGRGIGRTNGIPIFVVNAIPGEIVKVNITKEKKNFMEGEVINYINNSSERIKPICPYFEQCGGCDLMHLTYKNQLIYKENKVKEIMNKFNIKTIIKPIIGTKELYYRNKISLKYNKNLGYYKKKSYDIIPISKCLIADERINKIIEKLNQLNLNNVEEIIVRSVNGQDMINFIGKNSLKIDLKFIDTVDSVCLNSKCIFGKSYIVDKIGDYQFIISPKSFFQVNHDGMINLYNKVLEYCSFKGNENLLDLYCGTGTIGIYLSKYCNKVLGIEINEDAIRDANKNKELNNIDNIEFLAGDVKDVLKKTKFIPEIVVVDPPRAGLDKEAIDHLIQLEPNKIVYVSCDPMTLARDLKLLESKYDIVEITPVDMFSNTYHVECVCVLNYR